MYLPKQVKSWSFIPWNKSEYCYPHWMQVHPRRRLTTPPPPLRFHWQFTCTRLCSRGKGLHESKDSSQQHNRITQPGHTRALVSETSMLTVQPLRPWKCANRPAALHCKMLVGLSPEYVGYLHCTFRKALALITTFSPFCARHQYLPDCPLHVVSNLSVLPWPNVSPSLTHVMLGSGWPFALQ